ncbi:MAG TPA: hypothetical protein VH374_19960 [Polyangia bacterium]|jgi:hypothetical protein|nr:hypothetical protein [Polyangia bacterium]
MLLASGIAAAFLAAACEGAPVVPANPTWADVEPILRAECIHCHGGTAPVTGAVGDTYYRFDFYDMTTDVCGEAAQALTAPILGHGLAALIKVDITPPPTCERGRMPPAPALPLADWERETITRWASAPDPPKGVPNRDDRRPEIQLSAPAAIVDKRLAFTAVIDDPDGESVVGILKIGDMTLLMDRPGSFAADIDTSAWANGTRPISAVLCDGWSNFSYHLGNVEIKHK